MLVVVGILCEVVATMIGTLGKQLVTRSGKVEARARAFKTLGLLLTSLLGPVLDASAYALAPQSLVAPLNGLDIVWNACSAPFTLGEHLSRNYALGAGLVFLGSSLSSALGQHHKAASTLERERALFISLRFLIYAIAGVLLLLVCAVVICRRPRRSGDCLRGVALGGSAGFVAGNMFFLAEALGIFRECFQTGEWAIWEHPLPYLITVGAVVVAVSNIPLMAKALEEYDALFMITLFAGCQITTACVSAQVVLRELESSTWARYLGYWFCIGVIVLGIAFVGRQAHKNSKKPVPREAAEAEAEAPSPKESLSRQCSSVVWAGYGSGVGWADSCETARSEQI